MSDTRHNAIIVTSFDKLYIERVRVKAVNLFGNMVSPLIPASINIFYSFMIGPDGSSEGWDESNRYDELRAQYIKYLKKCHNIGIYTTWCEIQYGDDRGCDCMVGSSDQCETYDNA